MCLCTSALLALLAPSEIGLLFVLRSGFIWFSSDEFLQLCCRLSVWTLCTFLLHKQSNISLVNTSDAFRLSAFIKGGVHPLFPPVYLHTLLFFPSSPGF